MLNSAFSFINHQIKNLDVFGYHIDFNYKKNGSEYKTTFGGLASIVIRLFVFFIFISRLNEVLFFKSPDIRNLNIMQDLE